MENEKTIRDFLASDLSIVDSGLQFIAKEFRLPNDFGSKGYVDILAKDQYENYVIIEIKRTRASSRETLQEIFKYVGLIRQNFGAKDGEIRAIILSVDWDELFVPYCEFVEQSGLTADAYRLYTDGNGKVLKCELVRREPLPKIQRRLAPIYQGDMFFTKEKRDNLIPRLIEMSESIGIRDFVILSMSGDPKYEIMYPFAACYGFNTMTTEQYEEILERTGELDMEREEFENEQEYRDYMEQCILVSLKTGPWNDTMEAMMPHSLDSALSDKWSVDHIYRSGIFKTDPRLSDDLLISEMRGLRGTSDTRYSHFGNSEQKGRIEEIKKSCTIPFGDMSEWAAELEMCWKFLDAEKRRYRVEIVSYCPKSVFYGILRFLETGEDNALPGYLLIIDFYEDNVDSGSC